jgi:hypothetical protein
MRTKKEYYNLVQKNRKIASNPEYLKCPCPNVKCEWHRKCKECVAIHRHYKDHLPNCFKSMIEARIRAVAGIAEMDTVPKEKTPDEYRDYVIERDKKLK